MVLKISRYLFNLSMGLCIRLKPDNDENLSPRFRIIPLGKVLPRMIKTAGHGEYEYVLLEDVVSMFVHHFFPGDTVLECIPFRVTRNADFEIEESSVENIMEEMEEIIDARNLGKCVRLEMGSQVSEQTKEFLKNALSVTDDEIYLQAGPFELSSYMRFSGLSGFSHLKDTSWSPQQSSMINPHQSMFEELKHDVVLVHPYESFDPVVRLLKEAADDPDVLAIKQTLYRTSRDSPVVEALVRASENGKYVTAVVEIKARFDEARNIDWAKRLEQAGVFVLYGVKGLKTHAKCCTIIRREPDGIKRYVHFGTGNYNEVTSRLYTDISFMSSSDDLGEDAVNFFQYNYR